MCNRYVWLFTFIFWLAVFLIDGWRGVFITFAFSVVLMATIAIIERQLNG